MSVTSTAGRAGGANVSPGTAESSDTDCETHGGESVSPGTQGGELVCPAKAAAVRAQIKVKERDSFLRYFISYLLSSLIDFARSKQPMRSLSAV